MDINTVIVTVLMFIGALILGAFKAYERINNPGNPETWDKQKFATFVLVVGLIMILKYAADGGIQFPTDDIISAVWVLFSPIAGLFGFAITTITAGRLVKRDIIVPIVASVKEEAKPTPTPLPSNEVNWLSISVTPTYMAGKGMLPVTFQIYGTQPQPDHPGIASIDIDFADGSPMQTVTLIQDHAQVSHVFTFVKTPEYTGHTFYPIFKCNGSDGTTYLFNAGERKAVEIYVESL